MFLYDAEKIIIEYGRSNIVSVEPSKVPERAKEIKGGVPCEKNCKIFGCRLKGGNSRTLCEIHEKEAGKSVCEITG